MRWSPLPLHSLLALKFRSVFPPHHRLIGSLIVLNFIFVCLSLINILLISRQFKLYFIFCITSYLFLLKGIDLNNIKHLKIFKNFFLIYLYFFLNCCLMCCAIWCKYFSCANKREIDAHWHYKVIKALHNKGNRLAIKKLSFGHQF